MSRPWYTQGHHLSTECAPNGSGQCDGFDYEQNDECDCHCHTTNELPETIEGVKAWHDEYHGLKVEA